MKHVSSHYTSNGSYSRRTVEFPYKNGRKGNEVVAVLVRNSDGWLVRVEYPRSSKRCTS